MSFCITVRDESPAGNTLQSVEFEIPGESISVRELIRSRVYQDVKDYNVRQAAEPRQHYQGLVTPTESERMLNGKADPTVEWRRQVDRANDAFHRGQILILVDGRQVTALEDEITVSPETAISFLRLTPLAGG